MFYREGIIIKPFKTLDEQLKILEQRGLTISNPEKAKHYLLQYSYYNIINVYSKFFQNKPNVFIEGATFEEIKAVHSFDSEIKAVFFKHLIEAEKHFKSIFAYRFAEANPNIPYAYLKTNTYSENTSLIDLSNIISQLSKILLHKNKKNSQNAVRHYHQNHGDVPIWVIINELSFRPAIEMYKHLNDDLKNNIAKDLTIFLFENTGTNIKVEPMQIELMLFNLNDIRNCVAHDNLLLNFKARNNIKFIPEVHNCGGLSKTDPKQSVYSILLILQIFLNKGQYEILYKTIMKRIKKLSKKLNTIPIYNITDSLGFPREVIIKELSLK